MTNDNAPVDPYELLYLKEVAHVRDHLTTMAALALPDFSPEYWWETPEAKFQILFGSLERIRSKVGEENYSRILPLVHEVRRLFEASQLHEMALAIWPARDAIRRKAKLT